MRFVDEYRDPELAQVLGARIAALCEPGRDYKIMEVCGGHTHTIYRYGVQDHLPESIELVALDFVMAAAGDRVLVHAGVALERVDATETLGGEPDAFRR